MAYTTRDIEATLDFYTTKLGMPLIHAENHLHGDGYFRHFFFGLGNGEAIAFFALKDCGEEEGYKTAISTGLGLPNWANHIAFKLDTLEELEAKDGRDQSQWSRRDSDDRSWLVHFHLSG